MSDLSREAMFGHMTGGQSPTPLQELFGSLAVPLCEHPGHITMRVWYAEDCWHASWGKGGSVGGHGRTPEDAILQAHTNYITLRDCNALRARVADVKKRRRK